MSVLEYLLALSGPPLSSVHSSVYLGNSEEACVVSQGGAVGRARESGIKGLSVRSIGKFSRCVGYPEFSWIDGSPAQLPALLVRIGDLGGAQRRLRRSNQQGCDRGAGKRLVVAINQSFGAFTGNELCFGACQRESWRLMIWSGLGLPPGVATPSVGWS